MRVWLDSQRDWLTVERLPAYAPELNPVEYLWANLKDVELANLPTTTRPRSPTPPSNSDDLVAGFLAHTWLSLIS
jgi:transposase